MFTLLATLVGVALATVGMLLIASGLRHTGYPGRRSALAAAALVGIGGGLIWWQQIPTPTSATLATVSDQVNRLIEEEPTAAARNDNHFNSPSSALVVAWGTPSDDDKAGPDTTTAFATQLGREAASQLIARGHHDVSLRILDRAEFQVIDRDGLNAATWCDGADQRQILAIGLNAKALGDAGFAPWREPLFEILDCADGHHLRRTGRVTERLGDLFPYQLALRDEISDLLSQFSDHSAADAAAGNGK